MGDAAVYREASAKGGRLAAGQHLRRPLCMSGRHAAERLTHYGNRPRGLRAIVAAVEVRAAALRHGRMWRRGGAVRRSSGAGARARAHRARPVSGGHRRPARSRLWNGACRTRRGPDKPAAMHRSARVPRGGRQTQLSLRRFAVDIYIRFKPFCSCGALCCVRPECIAAVDLLVQAPERAWALEYTRNQLMLWDAPLLRPPCCTRGRFRPRRLRPRRPPPLRPRRGRSTAAHGQSSGRAVACSLHSPRPRAGALHVHLLDVPVVAEVHKLFEQLQPRVAVKRVKCGAAAGVDQERVEPAPRL